jgi:succinate dehydrogenase / fumarate reductase cytochrome b subunit
MDSQRYFLLKRLHSLAGVVPIAGFVAFHLFENSHSVAGAAEFNAFTAFMRSQPYLYLIEAGLLLPIAFHAFLGVYLARTAKYNNFQFGNRANWSYTLQRITGLGLVAFIGMHLYHTRFAGVPADQMFQHMAEGYSHPLIVLGYVLGIGAAAFHLANGLWGFAVAWGLVTGAKSMDALWKLCMGAGVAVFLMGVNALLGFRGQGVDFFQHEKTPKAAVEAPAAPAEAAPAPAAAKPAAKPANSNAAKGAR